MAEEKKRLEKQVETRLYRPLLIMRFKRYPIANGAPLKNFKQGSDMIKFTFYVSVTLGLFFIFCFITFSICVLFVCSFS